jgi:hypothetical protein
MIRKQIAASLTDLVKTFPDKDNIIQNWVEGVFPLILDVEQKAAEKVQEVNKLSRFSAFFERVEQVYELCY